NDNYTINRTWTAIDSCNNTSSCLQVINVQDTTRPSIICPPHLTISSEESTDTSNTGMATATDNCTDIVTDISYVDARVNGTCNDNYTLIRTWLANDSCGN